MRKHVARAGERRRWFLSEPPGFSRGEVQDGARVDGVGAPGGETLEGIAEATSALVPDWAAFKCDDGGHGGLKTLEYVRIAGYRLGGGAQAVEDARKAAEAAAQRIDSGAEVKDFRMLPDPPKLRAIIEDQYHAVEVDYGAAAPWNRESLAWWAYRTYARTVERWAFYPGVQLGTVPAYNEYKARLERAPKVDPAMLERVLNLVESL